VLGDAGCSCLVLVFAAQSFKRSFSALTTTKVLQLSGKPGVQLLGTPTRSSYESLSNRVMVVQTDLQYACEYTWVAGGSIRGGSCVFCLLVAGRDAQHL
jgi:hypothetical protein